MIKEINHLTLCSSVR